MTYLLDTMVVSFFYDTMQDELARAAGQCKMALVGEVYKELRTPKRPDFKEWFCKSNITLLNITVDSEAYMTLGKLVNPRLNSNLGERASIAWMANNTGFVFVTHDKNAMWIASREICCFKNSIMGVPVFLRRLFDAEKLSNPSVLDVIISRLDETHKPTWWDTWRSHL